MLTITPLDTGYCTQFKGLVMAGGGWRRQRFPAHAYLISGHGRHWLWDTGYSQRFHDATRHGLARIYGHVTPVTLTDDQSALAQLARRGLGWHDLDAIVLSHFHADHIAGLRDFQRTHLHCSHAAWQHMRELAGWRALHAGFLPDLLPDDFEQRLTFIEQLEPVTLPEDLQPFRHAFAMPGSAGHFLIVTLPGHAHGHLGAFIRTTSGWALLASDAAWSTRAYRQLAFPARPARWLLDDWPAYRGTLQHLHQLDRRGRVRILLSHEAATP